MEKKQHYFLLLPALVLTFILSACTITPGPIDNNWPYDRGNSSHSEQTTNHSFEGTYENYTASHVVPLTHNGWGTALVGLNLQGYAGAANIVVRDPQGKIVYAGSALQSISLGVPVQGSGVYPVELDLRGYSGNVQITLN